MFGCLVTYSSHNLHYIYMRSLYNKLCVHMRSRWYIRNFDDGFCGGTEKRLWNGAYRSCFTEFWSQTSLHTHVLPSVCMLTCDTNFANLIFTSLAYIPAPHRAHLSRKYMPLDIIFRIISQEYAVTPLTIISSFINVNGKHPHP